MGDRVAYADTEQTRELQARIAELEAALAAALAMTDAEKEMLQAHLKLAVCVAEQDRRIARLRRALALELRVNDLSLSNDEWLVMMSKRREAMRDVLDNRDLEEEPDGAQD